jgi:hypothetical protein
MIQPHLVLQYPDLQTGKVRLLAFTQDKRVLQLFKKIALEEARLTLLGCDDEVLKIEYGQELRKLEALLGLLIPDEGNGCVDD